jgi:hypothetical protein
MLGKLLVEGGWQQKGLGMKNTTTTRGVKDYRELARVA